MTRRSSLFPFHLSAFAWNFGLSMTYVLLPLFALELGMSGLAIGSLVSLPILLQVVLGLLGGAYADRVGAKQISLAACLVATMAPLIFVASASFAGLLAGQFLMIVSRAIYWPAVWALTSEMPGDLSRNTGVLIASSNAGQIAGMVIAGMVIAPFGFRAGFWIMAAAGLVAFVASMFMAGPSSRRLRAKPALWATYALLVRQRTIYFAIACACISALPYSLSASFYPILLVEQGFSSDATGWLMALRAAGSIVAGMLIARFVRRANHEMPPFASAVVSAACVGLMPLLAHPLWVGLFLLGIGVGSGVMNVYFQILISVTSTAEQRSSAMALGGVGWGVSNFATPIIVGALRDAWGIHTAFYLLGLALLLGSLALPLMQRWSLRGAAQLNHGPAR